MTKRLFIAIALEFFGLVFLVYAGNWEIALGVLLLIFGNNLSRTTRRLIDENIDSSNHSRSFYNSLRTGNVDRDSTRRAAPGSD